MSYIASGIIPAHADKLTYFFTSLSHVLYLPSSLSHLFKVDFVAEVFL